MARHKSLLRDGCALDDYNTKYMLESRRCPGQTLVRSQKAFHALLRGLNCPKVSKVLRMVFGSEGDMVRFSNIQTYQYTHTHTHAYGTLYR